MSRARNLRHLALAAGAAAATLVPFAPGVSPATASTAAPGAVYAMTNDATGNQVVAYRRGTDGQLRLLGRFDTGGLGTSRIRLSSQGSVLLSDSNRWLFVTNVGSDDVSVFRVRNDGLRLVDVVASGGDMPNSVTVDGDLVYVLNNGGAGVGNITGFRQADDGTLHRIDGSTQPVSAAGSDPAQVSFGPDGSTLVVTEKATNRVDTFVVGADGRPGPVTSHPSAGVTPFGFDFTRDGEFVVTEATGGIVGAATASSYALTGQAAPDDLRVVSPAVPDGRSEVCWTVISKDDRFAYITNFGDGTISSYDVAADGSLRLKESVAATTTFGQLSIRDEDLTTDGRFLYAIDISSQKVHGWRVGRDGSLTSVGAFAGLPGTVAGLAAS